MKSFRWTAIGGTLEPQNSYFSDIAFTLDFITGWGGKSLAAQENSEKNS